MFMQLSSCTYIILILLCFHRITRTNVTKKNVILLQSTAPKLNYSRKSNKFGVVKLIPEQFLLKVTQLNINE